MRRAHFDVGFMIQEDGTLVGLSLGYDRCAEHEWGTKYIERALGVKIPETPVGLDDRKATQAPVRLKFGRYTAKPRDKRRKGYPAAYLVLDQDWGGDALESNPGETLERMDASFIGQMTDKDHKDVWDCAASWSSSNFAVNVRGEKNIALLEEMYNAFKDCDISMAVPWARSFFRGGLAFVITSRVPEAERESIRQRDLESKKLVDAAKATGIYEELEAGDRKFYALSPDWLDRETQQDVIFFLNPREQSKYDHGWFTVDELRAWIRNEGPVIKHAKVDAFEKDNRDFMCNLLRRMEGKDIKFRTIPVLTLDGSGNIAVRLLVSKNSQHLLSSGTYAVADLEKRFPLFESAAS